MARGWESKAVESQIESAREGSRAVKNAALSAEQAAMLRERESLELSRTRVLQDMQTATHARYKEMLQRSLDFLDEKLAALDQLSKPDLRG
ncbi:MAG TPA: hypothetical protein VKX25_03000 [Bryobacteraceae bacterium]|jgi:molecular chaperone GrpE (heat shock protein)|nr:hypothetical protein [Bryobacteraceae bacterium]